MPYPLFYFGNIDFWRTLVFATDIDFNLGAQLPKKSYINRTIIASANGLQSLSIPIKGGRGSKLKTNEVEISYAENWSVKHKMALQSAYSKSPYYEFYMPYFEKIFAVKYDKLSDLNLALFKEIYRILKLEVPYSLVEVTEAYSVDFIPDHFNLNLKSYPQVFRYKRDFEPDLSILDLLFCLGPKSMDYLID